MTLDYFTIDNVTVGMPLGSRSLRKPPGPGGLRPGFLEALTLRGAGRAYVWILRLPVTGREDLGPDVSKPGRHVTSYRPGWSYDVCTSLRYVTHAHAHAHAHGKFTPLSRDDVRVLA